jgi:xylan 1,4-beta-xylosidase
VSSERSFRDEAILLRRHSYKFHCLAVTQDEGVGRALTILSCEGDYPEGRLSFPLGSPIALDAEGLVRLAVAVDHAKLQFAYTSGDEWRDAGPPLDASILSDEAGGGEHRSFTGAFVGMVAFDISGAAIGADFRYFDYEARDAEADGPIERKLGNWVS